MKQKLNWVSLLSILLLAQACRKTQPQEAGDMETTQTLMTRAQIDAAIWTSVRETGRFEWSSASERMILSALQLTDQVMSIGYKPAGNGEIDFSPGHFSLSDKAWRETRDYLLAEILTLERKRQPKLSMAEMLVYRDTILPVLNLRIQNPETVHWIKSCMLIRYAEPMGYDVSDETVKIQSTSGCGSNTPDELIAGLDYAGISPASKQSWNYPYHNITRAWTKSSGAGVKVFIIDTGAEFDQENLGAAFNQGLSAGRTVERIVTLPRETFLGIPIGPVETPDDACGHGTSMAGACAAPRGTDGAACGIAYNANLVTCRASKDVFIDESREVKGVSDAFLNAANRADVKIISMSMGRISSSSQIRDAILYAYARQKLIFCAAGTSLSWTSGWTGVIFPASIDQVSAVTGVTDQSADNRCRNCHDGPETDFTVVMEKIANGKFPLTLAMWGDQPSTVGGSSVATASLAGMAALVWSKKPGLTRDQLLSLLMQSSHRYPYRHPALGWGNPDVDKALQ